MSNVTEKKWFTIKEAAAYLSIGEPTLYRWMRDGKITYRKIGDSTRFLQEDLDDFVEVFTSQKESEKVLQKCPVCNSPNIVKGDFRTTGLNYFRPKKTKFWTIKDSNIKCHASMCAQCGAVTNFGDVEKLRILMEKEIKEPTEESKK